LPKQLRRLQTRVVAGSAQLVQPLPLSELQSEAQFMLLTLAVESYI
jgi:hypothetical protein